MSGLGVDQYALGFYTSDPRMHWFLSLVRIAGASFPVASSLVQLQAEMDSREFDRRLRKLEDPIMTLHPDMPEVSRTIYSRLQGAEANLVQLEPDQYTRFSRALALLEARGFIKGRHTLAQRFGGGLRVTDPSYIVFMAAHCADPGNMAKLVEMVDSCEDGHWLDGHALRAELGLPLPVIQAVFSIYESKGYGICSREIGASKYLARA